MIKWEIDKAIEDSEKALDLLLAGWEPFAVRVEKTSTYDDTIIHFRRQIPQEET